MAHKLLKVYSTKGIDTRTNRLAMDEKSWREGSKNMMIDKQDDLTQRFGRVHSDAGGYVSVGEFEYRYTDTSSGSNKSELLQIRTDGELYRRVVVGSLTVSVPYQIVYSGTSWVISFTGYTQTITFDTSKTLAQLVSDITALALGGLTASNTGSGAVYLLDGGFVYGWEKVPCPVTAPFLVDWSKSEGISSQNLNQVIYITVGGFVFKYDGKSVYRAGVPKDILPSLTTGTGSLASGVYRYKLQVGYKDARGAVYWGKITQTYDVQNYLSDLFFGSSGTAPDIRILPFPNALDFGQFGCISSVLQATSADALGTGATITVEAGHNVLAGMCLMLPGFVRSTGGTAGNTGSFSGYFSAKVASVTATTITLEKGIPVLSLPAVSGSLLEKQPVVAAYVRAEDENVWLIDQNSTQYGDPFLKQYEPYGLFVRIWRSKVGDASNFYKVHDMPLPRVTATGGSGRYDQLYYGIYDTFSDTYLKQNFVDAEYGEEIPRVCRYLASWQKVLVQGGIPADYDLYLSSKIMPQYREYSYLPVGWVAAGGIAQAPSVGYYTDNYLCDAQSLYWADPINPEGFSQSGAFENRFQNDFNDRIKGMRENKDVLFAFKEQSTAIMRGDPAGDIVVEFLETDAGLLDHRSICDVEGTLIWADSDKGFWQCIAGRLPVHIGRPISDQFQTDKISKTYAVAANWKKQDFYICYLPDGAFVFDYFEGRGFWYQWDGSFMSITSDANNNCFLSDRTRLWAMKDVQRDHQSAIPMDVRTAWINFKSPTVDKNYHRAWFNSIQGGFTLLIEQYANYLQTKVGSVSLSFLSEAQKKFVKKETKLNMEKLSAISVGITHNTIGEKVKIQGWELEYSSDFDLGEPRD